MIVGAPLRSSAGLHPGGNYPKGGFGTVAFTLRCSSECSTGVYRRLFTKQGSVDNTEQKLAWFFDHDFGRYEADQSAFRNIPSCTIAYWMSPRVRAIFSSAGRIGQVSEPRQGIITGDNNRFLRLYHEVSMAQIDLTADAQSVETSPAKWFPLNKGGELRKWYGNHDYVIDYQDNGTRIKNFKDVNGKLRSRPQNVQYYFREGVTWSLINISGFAARYMPPGFIFNVAGISAFSDGKTVKYLIGLLNSRVGADFLKLINPTLNNNPGDVAQIPFVPPSNVTDPQLIGTIDGAIEIARADWDNFETSWDFRDLPLLRTDIKGATLAQSWKAWDEHCSRNIIQMQALETENNRLWIEAYGLQDELTPEVAEELITLAHADREGDMKRLISYAVGCMIGRYSLDQPGLVYANSGNDGFDKSKYNTFPADDDGIIPVMEMDWFEDDAASRFEKFLKVAWSVETLEENLKFVADSLSSKHGETPRETIRRYFSTQFYKDHLQTYKKRPIYWLFSSGKQKACECLVYLHRYNETTLSRMRNEYVTPLHGKFSARGDYLINEIEAATSTSARNKLQKLLDVLKKKQVELAAFDDLLRHHADKRISLDLDDGVKVNYGKFGNLLAEVKAVTGGGED